MKTRRTLLLASIAAGGLLVAFASAAVPLSASRFGGDDEGRSTAHARPAGYREGGESDRHHERKAERDHDRRHAERDHDGEEDDDDEGRGGQTGPAKAGTATPPDNGLIRKGSTPKVQMN